MSTGAIIALALAGILFLLIVSDMYKMWLKHREEMERIRYQIGKPVEGVNDVED